MRCLKVREFRMGLAERDFSVRNDDLLVCSCANFVFVFLVVVVLGLGELLHGHSREILLEP